VLFKFHFKTNPLFQDAKVAVLTFLMEQPKRRNCARQIMIRSAQLRVANAFGVFVDPGGSSIIVKMAIWITLNPSTKVGSSCVESSATLFFN